MTLQGFVLGPGTSGPLGFSLVSLGPFWGPKYTSGMQYSQSHHNRAQMGVLSFDINGLGGVAGHSKTTRRQQMRLTNTYETIRGRKMPLETASHIASLNATNPASGDAVAQADDHLRLIKSVLTTDFATINAAITATPTEINSLGGILKTQLDRAGSLTTAGTATAYTLTSNTVFASLSAMNGKAVIFKPHVTSGVAPTLNVDGLGAVALKSIAGTVIPTGALLIGGRYAVTYNDSATEFVVHGIFGVLPATTFAGNVTVTTGGLTVTAGTSTFSSAVTFDSTVSLHSTDAAAAQGPTFDVFRDSASPANSDLIGAIEFNGRDSAGNKQLYTRFLSQITNATSTTEGSNFYIVNLVAGAETTVLQSSGADISIPGNLTVTGNITGKNPTAQRFTSGTAQTYTAPAGTVRQRVRMWGSGAGGGAQATNNGTAGNATSFQVNSTGTAWTANGGSAGPNGGANTNGGAGGTGGTNGSTGALIKRVSGSSGGSSNTGASATFSVVGGAVYSVGLFSPQCVFQSAGFAAPVNSGGGGGGALTSGTAAGGGGGGGEFVEFWVTGMTTATYTVGALAAGGVAGTRAGGDGAAGGIEVDEFYS